MQNKSSHTKKGAINIADTTIFLLQNPSTTDKIDTKYRVATPAQYGIYTSNSRAKRFMKWLRIGVCDVFFILSLSDFVLQENWV